MTIRGPLVLFVALLAGLSGARAQEAAAPLQTPKETVSYALGMNLAKQLRAQAVDVEPDTLHQGLQDALAGGKTRLSESQVQTIVAGLQKSLQGKQAELRTGQMRALKEVGAKNKMEGEAFLAENKAKDGVVTLGNGVQYRILKAAEGPKPGIDDTVVCHYRGTLIDGTEFDSSYGRKEPATFALRRVIKGWSEALQQMPVGSRWQIFVPGSLAYGARPPGRVIGPDATLIFEVELIAIKGAATAPTGKSQPPSAPGGGPTAGSRLSVTFKLDARLSGPTYGGARWVSPPTFTRLGQGKTCTVEARAQAVDASGGSVTVAPLWTPADPDLVTVTPSEGKEVKILVRRAGETTLRVSSQGLSKELAVKATYRGDLLQVEISQP